MPHNKPFKKYAGFVWHGNFPAGDAAPLSPEPRRSVTPLEDVDETPAPITQLQPQTSKRTRHSDTKSSSSEDEGPLMQAKRAKIA
jgi:hypothetical protein